jgi:Peptidase A4 family
MRRRPSRLAICSLAACVPALGLVIALAPAAGASTGSPASTHGRALAAARAALKHLSIGQHATDHPAGGHTAKFPGLSQVSSTNWSGYADASGGSNTYSAVTGNWTEPSVSCTSQTSLAAFWVGIDGYTSGSVEQDGTLAECYHGAAYYFTWWEMYPTNSMQVVGQAVRPGDSISASVVRSGTGYTLKVTDSSRSGSSFTTTQSCPGCANSSAEWIAEAPSGSAGVYPLANFHSWTETGATVKAGSATKVISSLPDNEITMIDSSGLTKALPGSLNGSGNGFSVTWARSS